jgi:hypothetical protein
VFDDRMIDVSKNMADFIFDYTLDSVFLLIIETVMIQRHYLIIIVISNLVVI